MIKKKKRNQIEIIKVRSTTTEIKILLEGLTGRFELAEERISELKDRAVEIMQSKLREKREEKWRASEKYVLEGEEQKEQKKYLKISWMQTSEIWWKTVIYTTERPNKSQMW